MPAIACAIASIPLKAVVAGGRRVGQDRVDERVLRAQVGIRDPRLAAGAPVDHDRSARDLGARSGCRRQRDQRHLGRREGALGVEELGEGEALLRAQPGGLLAVSITEPPPIATTTPAPESRRAAAARSTSLVARLAGALLAADDSRSPPRPARRSPRRPPG